jgi:hypothetical protein
MPSPLAFPDRIGPRLVPKPLTVIPCGCCDQEFEGTEPGIVLRAWAKHRVTHQKDPRRGTTGESTDSPTAA